jgi:hypothetical protein
MPRELKTASGLVRVLRIGPSRVKPYQRRNPPLDESNVHGIERALAPRAPRRGSTR